MSTEAERTYNLPPIPIGPGLPPAVSSTMNLINPAGGTLDYRMLFRMYRT